MKRRSALRVVGGPAERPGPVPRSGRLVRIDEGGRAWVEWTGSAGARLARLARAVSTLDLRVLAGAEVVLAPDAQGRPIVLDLVEDRLRSVADVGPEAPREAVVDGDRVVLAARERIELRCGRASIVLTRAGKILIRGAYVVSHSSGVQRIRGGSVEIN